MSSCARVCTSVRCEPTRALCFAASVYVCTVRAQNNFVRCELTRASCSVLVLAHQGFVPSACVLVRGRVQMSEPVHLYGASPQGFCASVYACTVRAQKGFVRCEPKRALYRVLVLDHQGVETSAYVLVGARVQMSSYTGTCTSVWCEPTSVLCFCAGGCADELMRGNLYVCTARAHKDFMQCASLSSCLYEVLVWNQYACVSYAKPAVERTDMEILNN